VAEDAMNRRLTTLFVYAVAMAFVEAAVVVYLRALFPTAQWTATVPFSHLVYRTEVIREVATIVMLLAVSYLSFERTALKVVTFFWIFAIWDLFYYMFLKAILGWPTSFSTRDVLFLIPFTWVAPVWVPLAVWTIALVVSSSLFVRLGRNRPAATPVKAE
jgi:hypothetical protein